MIVSDILDDCKKLIGECSDEEVFERLTEAIEILAKKSQWNPTVGFVDICAFSDCKTIALPRDVETPLAVNVGGQPRYFRDRWYEFHLNGSGSFDTTSWTWDDQGEFPIAMDIIKASRLVAVADLKTDVDKTIRVFGFDKNGKWVRTQEPDGTWLDGFAYPVNILSDFPSGIITPDTQRLDVRNFYMADITTLDSVGSHEFLTGSEVTLSLVTPPLPTPLDTSLTYFINAIDDNTVSLFTNRTSALTNTNPIVITSAQAASQIKLRNSRNVAVLTQFTSVTPHNISTGTLVSFSATTLPIPIDGTVDYYANRIDANNFTVHNSLAEAQQDINPIDVSTPGTAVLAKAKQYLAPRTWINFSVSHNFLQNDAVKVVNSTGALPEPLLAGVVYYVRVINATRITLHNNLTDASTGNNPITLLSSGTGITSVIKTLPAAASIGTSNNITAAGHNLNLSGGDFVQFQTSGTLPTPVSQNTTYRADPPSTADTFSLNTTAPAPVNITATGTGQLLLVISRAMSVGFSGQWETDATLISNGDAVKVEAEGGSLPSTNPVIDNVTTYYARRITDNTVELFTTSTLAQDAAIRLVSTRARASNISTIVTANPHGFVTGDFVDVRNMTDTTYNVERIQITVTNSTTFTYSNNGSNEGTIADATGQVRVANIKVIGPGAGNIHLVFERSVTATPFASLLRLSTTEYLLSGATVRFETDGALPAPLGVGTDYHVTIVSGLAQISDVLDNPITITNIGSGNHTMVIDRNFTVTIPTGYKSLENIYENGDAVTVGSTGTPPTPLISGITYYTRYIARDDIELYDTAAHAINTASTTGRIPPTATGTGTQTLSRFLDAYEFQKITRIAKDESQGFITLYAWDTGRATNLTILGNYYPDETEPRYRRIKTENTCQWVRMRYKKRTHKIVSKDDWIPLTSQMAIKMMLTAIRLYRNNFMDEGQKFEDKAVQYLYENEQNEDGPTSFGLQVNADIFTRPNDCMT